MDWTFYNLLQDYEAGKINREQFLTIYPDDVEWLEDIDGDKDSGWLFIALERLKKANINPALWNTTIPVIQGFNFAVLILTAEKWSLWKINFLLSGNVVPTINRNNS
jgi:hypothetical protein